MGSMNGDDGMEMLLKLPISISNWIIIDDALQHGTTDRRLFIKAFHDYGAVLPIFKVSELCMEAHAHLLEADFQYVLDSLWKHVAMS